MRKCKIFDQSDKEIATILIWEADNHKVGIILQVPYVANEIRDAYLMSVTDDAIIADLLNKANLENVKVKCD